MWRRALASSIKMPWPPTVVRNEHGARPPSSSSSASSDVVRPAPSPPSRSSGVPAALTPPGGGGPAADAVVATAPRPRPRSPPPPCARSTPPPPRARAEDDIDAVRLAAVVGSAQSHSFFSPPQPRGQRLRVSTAAAPASSIARGPRAVASAAAASPIARAGQNLPRSSERPRRGRSAPPAPRNYHTTTITPARAEAFAERQRLFEEEKQARLTEAIERQTAPPPPPPTARRRSPAVASPSSSAEAAAPRRRRRTSHSLPPPTPRRSAVSASPVRSPVARSDAAVSRTPPEQPACRSEPKKFASGERVLVVRPGRSAPRPGVVRDVNSDGSLAIGYDDGGRDYHVLSRLVRRPSATAPSASNPSDIAGAPTAGLPPPPPLEQRALDDAMSSRSHPSHPASGALPAAASPPTPCPRRPRSARSASPVRSRVARGDAVVSRTPPEPPARRSEPTTMFWSPGERVLVVRPGRSAPRPGVVRDVNSDGSLAIGYDDGGRDYHVLSRLVRRPSATAPSASTPLADAGTPAGLPPPPPLEQRALDEREHERWCYAAEEARPRRECERRQLEQMRCDEAERAEQARRKRADADITAEAARLKAEAIAKVISEASRLEVAAETARLEAEAKAQAIAKVARLEDEAEQRADAEAAAEVAR